MAVASYDYEDPDDNHHHRHFGVTFEVAKEDDTVEQQQQHLNDDVEEEKKKKTQIRNKYISNRRGSLAADLGDDDDMRNEIDRLTMAQTELQKELLLAMQMVEIAVAGGATSSGKNSSTSNNSNNEQQQNDNVNNNSINEPHWAESVLYDVRDPIRRGGQQQQDDDEDNMSSNRSLQVEIEEDQLQRRRKNTKMNFAKGFFEIVKRNESLESQKKRQLQVVQKSIQTIEPGMEDIMNCHQVTQEAIVAEQKEKELQLMNRNQQLQDLLGMKPLKNLEDEKQRQRQILKLSMGEDYADAMITQQLGQQIIIQKKQKELEQTRLVVEEKLKELNIISKKKKTITTITTTIQSTTTITENGTKKNDDATTIPVPSSSPEPQFWSASRKRLEFIMGRKKKEQSVRTMNMK